MTCTKNRLDPDSLHTSTMSRFTHHSCPKLQTCAIISTHMACRQCAIKEVTCKGLDKSIAKMVKMQVRALQVCSACVNWMVLA